MSASVLIKIGTIELQCSGSEDFLKEQISQLLSFAEAQSQKIPVPHPQNGQNKPPQDGDGIKLSTSSIAAKIGGSSGTELITAACLRIAHDGQETFKRSEILVEMKSATSYFKASYAKNLSNYLKTLVQGGKLLEQSKDVFALPADVQADLESKLA
jgi:hypothetical protein